MIDVHSHIIPKIDDGVTTQEEADCVLEEASKAGFTEIISTSHYMEGHYEVEAIKRKEMIEQMNQRIKEKGMNLTLHCGAEAYITPDLVKLVKQKKVCTLANSRYLLFELPMNTTINYLDEVIFEIESVGLIPVIAHPERYLYIQEQPNKLVSLIQKGVLFQANYGSILGRYGKEAQKTLKKLLQANMIHFLGSDVHKKESIYGKIKESMVELEKVIGKDKLEELTTINPSYILKDEEIDIDEPQEIKTGFAGLFKYFK